MWRRGQEKLQLTSCLLLLCQSNVKFTAARKGKGEGGEIKREREPCERRVAVTEKQIPDQKGLLKDSTYASSRGFQIFMVCYIFNL